MAITDRQTYHISRVFRIWHLILVCRNINFESSFSATRGSSVTIPGTSNGGIPARIAADAGDANVLRWKKELNYYKAKCVILVSYP